jgi:hypothetical protein
VIVPSAVAAELTHERTPENDAAREATDGGASRAAVPEIPIPTLALTNQHAVVPRER